jgi:uncharacterized protein (TIGR03067 family)
MVRRAIIGILVIKRGSNLQECENEMGSLLSFARSWLLAYFSITSFGELLEFGKLQGTWIVSDAEVFHFEIGDGPVGSRFTFKGNHLLMEGMADCEVKVDGGAYPKEMNLIGPINDLGTRTTRLCIYHLLGDRLRICFGGYQRYARDGKAIAIDGWERPTKFEFSPHSFSYHLKRQQ